MHTRVCMCVLARVCASIMVEARHQPEASASITLHLVFEAGSVTEPDTVLARLAARNPTLCQDLRISAPLVLGLHAHLLPRFYVGAECLSLGFHACVVDTLLNHVLGP